MAALRFSLIAALVLSLSSQANAQYRAYRHMARMHAMHAAHMSRYAAPVAVGVRPTGSVRVSTPYYSFSSPGVVYHGPSPGAYGYHGPYGSWRASVSPGGVSVSVESPVGPTVATPTPHSAQRIAPPLGAAGPTLAAPTGDLTAQLVSTNAVLNQRLDLFNGGAGWQRYLVMSDEVIADPAQREKRLRRMDSVARDPQFRMISQLPEFQQLHMLLKASVEAPNAPAMAAPAAAGGGEAPLFKPNQADGNQPEEIPAPSLKPTEPSPTPAATNTGESEKKNERSVLTRG